MTRILIVDDDLAHTRKIERALDDMGIKHLHAASAEEAVEIARQTRIRMYLVDVTLPGVSGFAFVKLVRDRTNAPVIFMGDLDDEAQKVYGFTVGADDYLVKPFGMLELSCRIRAILRRCEVKHWHTDVALGLDRARRTATFDGRQVKLTRIEFDLLYQLAMAGGSTVSKATLIREVWGDQTMADSAALKERMRNLRKKVGKRHILSVYGDAERALRRGALPERNHLQRGRQPVLRRQRLLRRLRNRLRGLGGAPWVARRRSSPTAAAHRRRWALAAASCSRLR